MILIDIGNTNIVFAVSSNKILKKIIRIESNQSNNKLNIVIKKIIKNLIKVKLLDNSKIAIISSVVPSLNKLIVKILKINKINDFFLKSRNLFPFLKIDYDLNEIGAPGINLSKNSLINNTSLLKNTDIAKTKKIVAKNTKGAIRSGFYWGYVFAINGIIDKIIKEKKFKPKIILTGGLANIFKNDIRPRPAIKPNLTLEGLQIIGLRYYVKK